MTPATTPSAVRKAKMVALRLDSEEMGAFMGIVGFYIFNANPDKRKKEKINRLCRKIDRMQAMLKRMEFSDLAD